MSAQFIEPKTLIDELLSQQKSLTAAARFAEIHEQHALPAQARYYRDLIPLEKPRAGEQYAFEVDLDKCSGCKACVTACHSLNGLDEDEVWRKVGLLSGAGVQKPVTTACHHCADPACLNGCPVLAYEKDSLTGIVKHLDDQCIGCSYCVLKCPYEVPKYSAKRGIVRKCDMCSSRLAVGEAPACVQACPNEAIRIAVVDREEVSRQFAAATANTFLPDSPAPQISKPTTKYLSAEPLLANLRGADHAEIKPAQAHPSLVFFLVLTQMSVGGFLATWLTSHLPVSYKTAAGIAYGHIDRTLGIISIAAGFLGLVLSVTHLGRPLKAWRAFLGVRRSWLSREILAFGGFAPLAMLLTLSLWLPGPFRGQQLLAAGVWLAGMSGVLCSVMVYHDTRREFWSWPGTTIKFFGTTLLLGAALLTLKIPSAALLVLPLATLKFIWDLSESARSWSACAPRRSFTAQRSRTATLLNGSLSRLFSLRLLSLLTGGLILPLLILNGAPASFSIAALITLTLSELLERHLFFTAVSPDRMPGVPS